MVCSKTYFMWMVQPLIGSAPLPLFVFLLGADAEKLGQTWALSEIYQFPRSICAAFYCLDWLWGMSFSSLITLENRWNWSDAFVYIIIYPNADYWLMLAQLYFNASDPLSELWKISWVIPAFWTLLALALLVVICVLWAPSSNPTRYLLWHWDAFIFLVC